MINVNNDVSLVLSGGGAHAAYQVGFLRCLADHCPDIRFPILTGISAGAINAAFIANHQGTFPEATDALNKLWLNLSIDQVYDADAWSLAKRALHWGAHLLMGGVPTALAPKALVDTAPLRKLLQRGFASSDDGISGIRENIRQQKLNAI